MIHRFRVSARIIAATLAIISALFLLVPHGPADATPGKHDRLVAQLVCGYLQRGHLARPAIDDELSRRLFQRFFKSLDPTKLYFLRSDIEQFKKDETDLDDMLLQGDTSFAYKVYERFLSRIGERLKLVEEQVNGKHDFNAKESLTTDFDHIDYAQNDDELRERWRKRIKFDLLLQRIGKKPVTEAEARQKVLARYQGLYKRWKQVDSYDLMEMYLSDLTSSVDPHSSYMSPNTVNDFDIAMRLHLEGIGALLGSENGQTTVKEVIAGGAAARDGRLKVNDKIIGVAQGDGQYVDVIDMKLTEVVKLIRGPKGTAVELKIVPAEKIEPVVYTLTRQNIELKSQEARGEIIEQGKKADGTTYRIGVIDLPSFYADMAAARAGDATYKSATEDVRRILKQFIAKNVDGVILDLRHNGGGALTEAQALTGLFIDEGPVVQVKGGQGRIRHLDDPEKGVVYGGPLIVLVSRLSASASEILAGALQDYGRALIVGDSATHGKGTVQQVIDLAGHLQTEDAPPLGALKLTIQQFYRVNGDSTQSRGVSSDVVLPSITEHLASGESELDYALPFDHVQPIEHEELGMVPADLKEYLKTRSAERTKNSREFAKLIQEIEQLKTRKARKEVPLNEQELKDQFAKDDAEKIEAKADGLPPSDAEGDKGVFKFRRNYLNNEILQIMEDMLQARKMAASQ
jgi:carboxyl-terminal processing protease